MIYLRFQHHLNKPHQCLNWTTTAVILSHPTPPEDATSEAIILSNIYSKHKLRWPVYEEETVMKNSLTNVTHSWEVRQSHIPSQAIIRKSFSGDNYYIYISGTHDIIYSSGFKFLSDLYSKSPRDLDRLSTPLTLYSSTKPPAFSILFFSKGKSGLWSILISRALPFYDKTHLESPEFATIIYESVISATQAVQPVYRAILSVSGRPNNGEAYYSFPL